jgi:hypothetical protein
VKGITLPNGPLEADDISRLQSLHATDIVDFQLFSDRWQYVTQQLGAKLHARIVTGGYPNATNDASDIARHYSPVCTTIRTRNELNIEGGGVTPQGLEVYLEQLGPLVRNLPVYVPAVSPSTDNALQWIGANCRGCTKGGFKGLDVHAYGTLNEFEATLYEHRKLYTGLLIVTEYNFGAGRSYDLQRYADDWASILDIGRRYNVQAICAFIWKWNNPDMSLPTTVDVKGTPFEITFPLVLTPVPEVKPMKLVVAIVPSNQDRNLVLGGGNEMQQVAPFAEHLFTAFQQYDGITTKIFTAEPESSDAYEYEALYSIQKEVAGWLKSYPTTEYFKLATNWHTDSGTYSHVGGYFETYSIESKRLVDLLTPLINKWFNGSINYGNYSGYIFAKSLKGVAPAVLFELGSHQLKIDIEVLAKYGSAIAAAIAGSIAAQYKQTPQGIIPHLDMMWGYSNELTKASVALTTSAQGALATAQRVAEAADVVRERIIAIKQELGLN